MFRSMVLAALGVALVAGLVLSAVQVFQVSPIIYAAETFEIQQPEVAHTHDDGHTHDHDAWAPADGIERIGYTALSNFLSAFGFALILMASMFTAKDKAQLGISWRRGILWGLAGYATVFLIPAIGLTPEIPGMEAAALDGRQSWWILAVLSTGLGFASLTFLPGVRKACALLFFAAPWIVGAPHPEMHGFAHPDPQALASLEALQAQFVYATAIANAVFWVVLGALAGYASRWVAKD